MKRAFAVVAVAACSALGLARTALADEWSSQLAAQNFGCGSSSQCASNVCPGAAYYLDGNGQACCQVGTNTLAQGDAGFGAMGTTCTSTSSCCHWSCSPMDAGGSNRCIRPDGFTNGHGGPACHGVYDPDQTDVVFSSCDAGSDCCSGICSGGGHGRGLCVQPSQGTCNAWYQCNPPQICTYDAGLDPNNQAFAGTCQSAVGGPCLVDQDCLYANHLGCVLGNPPDAGTCQAIEGGHCPQGVIDCPMVDGGYLCIEGQCEAQCFSDPACLTNSNDLTRCQGYCCGNVHAGCGNTADCCPTDAEGAVVCGQDFEPGFQDCCVPNGGSCVSSGECCQPNTSFITRYQSFSCQGTHREPCQTVASSDNGNATNCCSGEEHAGTCSFGLGQQGCNNDSDCCTQAGGQQICGGAGFSGGSGGSSEYGWGICCDKIGGWCNSNDLCCDGYCDITGPDAGICAGNNVCVD